MSSIESRIEQAEKQGAETVKLTLVLACGPPMPMQLSADQYKAMRKDIFATGGLFLDGNWFRVNAIVKGHPSKLAVPGGNGLVH